MANLSSAFGTFKLCGTWTEEMIKNINALKKEWAEWDYWTCISDDFNNDQLNSTFSACGRWAYNHNLESLGAWTKLNKNAEILNAYNTLCDDMEKSSAYIEIGYTDEESGCEVLYTATAKISAIDGEFLYEETEYMEYDYNPENLIKLEVYEDIDNLLESKCFNQCEYCNYKKLCEQNKLEGENLNDNK